MDRKSLSFRSIAYQEKDNTFTGVCLDLDIVEEGHVTLQEAILSINDAVASHIQAIAGLGYPKELIDRPAPEEYWKKLNKMVHIRPKMSQFQPFQFFTTAFPMPNYAAI